MLNASPSKIPLKIALSVLTVASVVPSYFLFSAVMPLMVTGFGVITSVAASANTDILTPVSSLLVNST